MADVTSLTPPSTGLSATLFPNKSVEFYSPKGPENVKITILYRCTGSPHGTTTAVVSSKPDLDCSSVYLNLSVRKLRITMVLCVFFFSLFFVWGFTFQGDNIKESWKKSYKVTGAHNIGQCHWVKVRVESMPIKNPERLGGCQNTERS